MGRAGTMRAPRSVLDLLFWLNACEGCPGSPGPCKTGLVAASDDGGRLGELEARLAALRERMEAGLPERATELRKAMARAIDDPGARLDVARIAHKLHGIAGSHGHAELGAQAAIVEAIAKGAEGPLIPAVAELLRRIEAVAGQRATPAPTAPVVTKKRLGGLRIAALDDDDATRRLLDLTLTSFGGADAKVFATCAALRAHVASGPLDLVIVDAMMPEMSGLDVIHELCAAHPELRFAILSASTSDELGWELEKILWLRKPFRPSDIVESVAGLFGRT